MPTYRDPGRRMVAWTKIDPIGAEIADVTLTTQGMLAAGTAIGSDPEPYRLDYELETDDQYVTRRVDVRATAEGWSRALHLMHDGSGTWTVDTDQSGHIASPAPGGDPRLFADALDADLGLSPLFNTMPVLRHGLHESGSRATDLLMVWISVPDLRVHPSRQRYTPLRPAGATSALVLFEALSDEAIFRAEIEFDTTGLVVDYPGLATRIRR